MKIWKLGMFAIVGALSLSLVLLGCERYAEVSKEIPELGEETPVTPALTPEQQAQIDALNAQIAELTAKIDELQKAQEPEQPEQPEQPFKPIGPITGLTPLKPSGTPTIDVSNIGKLINERKTLISHLGNLLLSPQVSKLYDAFITIATANYDLAKHGKKQIIWAFCKDESYTACKEFELIPQSGANPYDKGQINRYSFSGNFVAYPQGTPKQDINFEDLKYIKITNMGDGDRWIIAGLKVEADVEATFKGKTGRQTITVYENPCIQISLVKNKPYNFAVFSPNDVAVCAWASRNPNANVRTAGNTEDNDNTCFNTTLLSFNKDREAVVPELTKFLIDNFDIASPRFHWSDEKYRFTRSIVWPNECTPRKVLFDGYIYGTDAIQRQFRMDGGGLRHSWWCPDKLEVVVIKPGNQTYIEKNQCDRYYAEAPDYLFCIGGGTREQPNPYFWPAHSWQDILPTEGKDCPTLETWLAKTHPPGAHTIIGGPR